LGLGLKFNPKPTNGDGIGIRKDGIERVKSEGSEIKENFPLVIK